MKSPRPVCKPGTGAVVPFVGGSIPPIPHVFRDFPDNSGCRHGDHPPPASVGGVAR